MSLPLDNPLDRLEVFFGDASHAAARVYARLPGDAAPTGCWLAGSVVGPTCRYASTLSAAVPLLSKRSAAVGESGDPRTIVAEAVVPDPCFWSAEMPFLYRVDVELRRDGPLPSHTQRLLGIRPLGVKGRRLIWEAKPWVPRTVDRTELSDIELPMWREADLAMCVAAPDDELCEAASRLGVVIVAELSCGGAKLAAELRRLSRWAAVAIAVLSAQAPLDRSIRGAARNVLLAQPFDAGTAVEPAAWADLVVCQDADAERLARRAADCPFPVIARRPAGWRDDPAEARRECDRLQHELAGRGDFAGYLV